MTGSAVLDILDLARWAPSGDNTQPWRFEVISDQHIAIHGFDTRDHVIYDYEGHASHMAHGALLETLRLAATRFGMKAEWQLRDGCPDTAPIYDVALTFANLPADPLAAVIEKRCVQRRPMRATPLLPPQREALAAAAGHDHRVQFFESWRDRLSVASLLWRNAHLRLTCPEAYQVHREIIEWKSRFSKDRVPEQAVGVDPLTARIMHWVMQRWERVDFFNRYLLGTVPPRIQLDLLPAIGCAAHVLLRPRAPLTRLEDYVAAGIAMQRLWLTATSLGLHLQPEMTPVIFRWYVRANRRISLAPGIDQSAGALARQFESLSGARPDDGFAFFCRIGHSPVPRSRSIRQDLTDLMASDDRLQQGIRSRANVE